MGCEPNGIDDGVVQQRAEFIEHRDLAAGAQAGIDGQDSAMVQRRLQQQAAQIAGEHGHGMGLGLVGQLVTNFAFQAGQSNRVSASSSTFAEGRHGAFVFAAGDQSPPGTETGGGRVGGTSGYRGRCLGLSALLGLPRQPVHSAAAAVGSTGFSARRAGRGPPALVHR